MLKAIETNKVRVVDVSEDGCTCVIKGQAQRITWSLLDDAAEQGNSVLARLYLGLRDRARKMVEADLSLPITCRVHQDQTNVWWVASFYDVAGQWSWIPRGAAEGGTLAHRWMAEEEAKERTRRLQTMGYTVLEAR